MGYYGGVALHGKGRDAQCFPLKFALQILIFKMFSLTRSKQGCDRYGFPGPTANFTNPTQWHFLQMLLYRWGLRASGNYCTLELTSELDSAIPAAALTRLFLWILPMIWSQRCQFPLHLCSAMCVCSVAFMPLAMDDGWGACNLQIIHPYAGKEAKLAYICIILCHWDNVWKFMGSSLNHFLETFWRV